MNPNPTLMENDKYEKRRTHELEELRDQVRELKKAKKERDIADEALRESEERFRATFNQAAVGIAHVALDGHFMRFNQKYCDIAGYTHDELIKRTYQSITHPDDLGKDMDQYNRLLKGKVDTFSMEKRYIRKDSSVVWVYLTASLVRGQELRPKYFIAVVEDITERKRTEDSVRKSREMLRLVMDNIPQAIFWKEIGRAHV